MFKYNSEKNIGGYNLEEIKFFENIANDNQIEFFKKIVGEQFIQYLIDQGITINVLRKVNLSLITNSNYLYTSGDSISSFDITANKEVAFTINIHGKKVIFQYDNYIKSSEEQRADSKKNDIEIIYISFLFESDFINGGAINSEFYNRTNGIEAIGGNGLYSNSIAFYQLMRKIISLIDGDVNVRIQATDSRRYRIYKRGLANLKNITIIPPSSHETPRSSRSQK